MRHRIKARKPRDAGAPRIERDPAVLASYVSDAAHVPGGFAAGIAFPTDESDVAALMRRPAPLLAIGAQSSLTGGATPRGELIVSTRRLTDVRMADSGVVAAGAGVPLKALQQTVNAAGRYYPPVPTYDGAFVGGTVSTNAAGAATFKYGATRPWVEALTIVLASGEVLDLVRGQTLASAEGAFEIEATDGRIAVVPIPSYVMPEVVKLSAGYFARPGMDLIDLFIGSEGTLGVITQATLRTVPRPLRMAALVRCSDDAQAVAVTRVLRLASRAFPDGPGRLDVSAVEYMDARALRALSGDAFAQAHLARPADSTVLLLAQIETSGSGDEAIEDLQLLLHQCGIVDDPVVALPGDERAAERLFALREAVPAAINAKVAAAQEAIDPAIEKTAGDMVVPFDRLAESIEVYRRTFEREGLDYAIWGHVSDGNLHPNVIPRSLADVERGRAAILAIAREVIRLGGAPLAEHGVGRSPLKQRLLQELYGAAGVEQMRAVKRALDPEWKLAPGVIFPAPP